MTIESAERPVFAWVGLGGIPDDAAKGEWFTDPSGKLRQAIEDLPKGYIPWLEPDGNGAWRGPQDDSGAFHLQSIVGYAPPTELDMLKAKSASLVKKAKALVDLLEDAETNHGGLYSTKTLRAKNELRLELARW